MKRLAFIPLVLLTLFWTSIAVADWNSINDEVEIDFQTHEIRVFVTAKDWKANRLMAPKLVYDYICTLTVGEDHKKLSDVFKARKTMDSKVRASIKKSLFERDSVQLDSGEITVYHHYPLKNLLSFFPDLNMPGPGDQ